MVCFMPARISIFEIIVEIDVFKLNSIVFSCLFLLSACSTEGNGVDSSTAKGAGAGAVTGAVVGGVSGASVPVSAGVGAAIGGVLGYIFSQHPTVLQSLGASGVSVMRLGDNVTIIIPSQKLFVDYSVKISSSGDNILQQVAKLLQPMNKVKISIAAYAAAPRQSERDLFLTEKQAQVVSNYFWDHDMDARMIYAVGYGGGHPIQYQPNLALNSVVGDYTNYRVEITLKDYIA